MSEQMYTTDTAVERLTRSIAEAVESGGRFSRAEFSVDDVSTILELLQAAGGGEQSRIDELVAWIDHTLTLPMYSPPATEDAKQAVADFKSWRRLLLNGLHPVSGLQARINAMHDPRRQHSIPITFTAGEVDWEYGYNTGSTVTFVGNRAQIEEWALVRGMAVGSGDWGSRIVRRRKAGPWIEVAS